MKKIARLLVKHDIVRVNFENPFKWTSGISSPIYCDCRELMSLVKPREQIVQSFLELIEKENLSHDIIAGTATAGISWASSVSDKLRAPMLYVRSKPKGHGAGKMVEGRGEKNKKILVIEDAISTGGSSAKSVEALRSELNAVVSHIIAIFSWSTKFVPENEKKYNVKFLYLTQFDEIVEALIDSDKITKTEKESLEDFHANPKEWGVRNGFVK